MATTQRAHRDQRLALFEKYVMPYERMIYKLVMTYTFDKSYVEDNYTQCLYNYYHFIDTYNPAMEIRTWLHIVCKRFVVNLEMRRAKGLQTTDDVDIDNDTALSYDPYVLSIRDITPDNWREAFSDGELRAMNEMKPIYVESLLLQLMGYTLKEIADISYRNGNLKTNNIDTIKSRLFLAKRYLRNHLTEDGEYRGNKEDGDSLSGYHAEGSPES